MFPRKMFSREMLPRKASPAWEIFAPAKLNLYLEVVGPRTEGFHPLETLMVPVRIFDQLRWTPNRSDGHRLRVRNFIAASGISKSNDDCDLLGSASKNLVLRAADQLAQAAGVEPKGCFELVKRIPIQAGLGGGSSDAAAALLLANVAWKVNYTRKRLLRIAEDLGSDVPFFLGSGPAVCRGRGEQIESIFGLPRLHFVIVKPPFGLSTPKVFEQLNRGGARRTDLRADSSRRLTRLVEALRRGAVAEAGPWMVNCLEAAAEGLTDWITRIRHEFARFGCWGHFMTGSGTAYVGVMRSARETRRIARSIAGMGMGSVFATSNC